MYSLMWQLEHNGKWAKFMWKHWFLLLPSLINCYHKNSNYKQTKYEMHLWGKLLAMTNNLDNGESVWFVGPDFDSSHNEVTI